MVFVTTYKLDDLAGEAGVAPRTVRYYVQRGLLPAPEFRGKDTSYGREHLARLRAIKVLQQAHLPLEEIQARLAGASLDEIERVASGAPPRGPAARCPGPEEVLPPPAGAGAPRGERWERVEIAEGVELHVRSDAPEGSRRIALDIESRYSTLAPKGAR
ncbi:MerR family transcriptional regulator [Sorangium cellulosum]|uniref:MerR family transcriptional regulator n=1 Tax=Sorangium cellulosum TaxID=56 RepID=A0A2L0EPA7_SORCE|nr:helix-turn-helix domain-containing protein [Sorangium cellulosum]AUX41143.1 MerR family transcriptional regulator [Sorangium cellulosum]